MGKTELLYKQKKANQIVHFRPQSSNKEVMQEEEEGYHQPHENSCVEAETAVDITAGKVRWQNKIFCTFSWNRRGFKQIYANW